MEMIPLIFIIMLAVCMILVSNMTASLSKRLSAQEKKVSDMEDKIRALRLLVKVLGARPPQEAD